MAQKLATLYHLLLQREQLLTSDLHSPPALIALRGTALVREAWTDIVEAGVGRRADLGQMTLSSQISPTPGWTLPNTELAHTPSIPPIALSLRLCRQHV